MDVNNEETDGEIEKALVDQPKPAEVLHMLQKIKTSTITSTDAKLI